MIESIRVFGWDARMLGVLAKPSVPRLPVAIVCWGTQAYHRIGPSRFWCDLSETIGRNGGYCLRFDPCGRGDSETRPEGDLFSQDIDDALTFLTSEIPEDVHAEIVVVAHGPAVGEAIDAVGRDKRVRGLVLLPTERSGIPGDPPKGVKLLSIGLGIDERRPAQDRFSLPEADGGLMLAADRDAVLAAIMDWLVRIFPTTD